MADETTDVQHAEKNLAQLARLEHHDATSRGTTQVRSVGRPFGLRHHKRGARHNGGLGSGSGGGYGTQLRFGAGDATSPYGEEPTRTDRARAAARASVTWHLAGR